MEPVYMLFKAELVNGPKDLQALNCINQVLDHLQLSQDERRQVLKFAHEREEIHHG